MIIYAGIDGSGTDNNAQYEIEFRDSFVNRLYRNQIVPFSYTFYRRGPTNLGSETYSLASKAFEWVVDKWTTGQAKAVFLSGYSRGGAAMIEVASWLKPLNIPVECLILFDAVDRCGNVGGDFYNTPIASNVKQTIHPMRDITRTLSRVSFQRCGQTQEDPNMPHNKRYFFTTHGGAGGVPWKTTDHGSGFIDEGLPELTPTLVTPANDLIGSTMVGAWTFPQVSTAYNMCRARLETPVNSPPPQIPGSPGNIPPQIPGGIVTPGGGQRIHIVKTGDWLSKIALTYYGDMTKWELIHKHPDNFREIGPNPDLIKPGQRLIIP